MSLFVVSCVRAPRRPDARMSRMIVDDTWCQLSREVPRWIAVGSNEPILASVSFVKFYLEIE